MQILAMGFELMAKEEFEKFLQDHKEEDPVYALALMARLKKITEDLKEQHPDQWQEAIKGANDHNSSKEQSRNDLMDMLKNIKKD